MGGLGGLLLCVLAGFGLLRAVWPAPRRWSAHDPLRLAMAPALVTAGCASETASLTVRIQTGLRAGHEVRLVETSVHLGSASCSGTSTPLAQAERVLAPGDQPARPVVKGRQPTLGNARAQLPHHSLRR